DTTLSRSVPGFESPWGRQYDAQSPQVCCCGLFRYCRINILHKIKPISRTYSFVRQDRLQAALPAAISAAPLNQC
ncbi:hypothetical protein, partial [Sutterella wadsworthensis]|uniref:hypothetical protein n=1 Tax=Sutterella wadsworthensis TaxID=40545 RepID=UPI002672F1EC